MSTLRVRITWDGAVFIAAPGYGPLVRASGHGSSPCLRPNIVLIVSDDHAAWALGGKVGGQPLTPHLDALAARGWYAQQALTVCPVCSPARASLATGLMPSQHGIHDWLQEWDEGVATRDWLAGVDTLPAMLQRGGYYTALSGKWHLGVNPVVPRGFDRTFLFAPKVNTHTGRDHYRLDGTSQELEGNRSAFVTDYALRFLDEAPRDRPFFLQLGYFATHSPYRANHHDNRFLAALDHEPFAGMPRVGRHRWARPENGPPPNGDFEAEARARWQGYHAAVQEIDAEVGRVLVWLEATGQREQTVVIYTADHGCCLGHHGVWGKGNGTRPVNFYETSLRVPLMAAGAGLPEGVVHPSPCTHLDVFASLARAAAVQPTDGLPRAGVDIFSGQEVRRELQDEALTGYSFHEYGDARAIRTPRTKVVLRGETGPHEYFDLIADPTERRSLPLMLAPDEMLAAGESFFARYRTPSRAGTAVTRLPQHNDWEPWRDGLRERNLSPG